MNALHNLEIEAGQQRDTTSSARQSRDLFTTRYEGGVDNYLHVITWQTSLLQNQQNDIENCQASLRDNCAAYQGSRGRLRGILVAEQDFSVRRHDQEGILWIATSTELLDTWNQARYPFSNRQTEVLNEPDGVWAGPGPEDTDNW